MLLFHSLFSIMKEKEKKKSLSFSPFCKSNAVHGAQNQSSFHASSTMQSLFYDVEEAVNISREKWHFKLD